MEKSESSLIRAIGNGDQEAFKCLVERYQKPLLNFIYRYVGNRHTAEDLTQEVFLRIYQAASRFEPMARVSTWIFKIAVNLCKNELKTHQRRSRLLQDLHETADLHGDSKLGVMVENRQMQQETMEALNNLPESQRVAMLLRIFEGMSYKEIASVMETSISSVESLIFRARTRLKQLLSDCIGD